MTTRDEDMEAADAARSPEAQQACDAACACVDLDDYEGARAHLAPLDPTDIEVIRIRRLIAFMEAE